jgi:hypothetical protein
VASSWLSSLKYDSSLGSRWNLAAGQQQGVNARS